LRSEFRTHWGSGAKEPRTGIYSEHGDCALLQQPSLPKIPSISIICYSCSVHIRFPNPITIDIALIIATLCFVAFQSSQNDFVRNQREFVYILALAFRVLSFLVSLALLLVFVNRKNMHSNQARLFILSILLVLLVIQSIFFYTTTAKDSSNQYCLNQVHWHGALGDICWLPN
jgi:hypothetical protein